MFRRTCGAVLAWLVVASGVAVAAPAPPAPSPDVPAAPAEVASVPDTGGSLSLDLEPVPPQSDEPTGEVPEKLIESAGVIDQLPVVKGGDIQLRLAGLDSLAAIADDIPVKVGPVLKDEAGRASPGELLVSLVPSEVSASRGIVGVALQLSAPEEGSAVRLEFDYSSFRGLYGGGFGERLQLLEFPACVLTSPKNPECNTGVPVKGAVNDNRSLTVSGVVEVAYDTTVGNERTSTTLATETASTDQAVAVAAVPSSEPGSAAAAPQGPAARSMA